MMSYFFEGMDNEKGNYVLLVDEEQLRRQLFAQYPPLDTIKRSAVMKCYSKEANQRISQMWINIRCYDMEDLFEVFSHKIE